MEKSWRMISNGLGKRSKNDVEAMELVKGQCKDPGPVNRRGQCGCSTKHGGHEPGWPERSMFRMFCLHPKNRPNWITWQTCLLKEHVCLVRKRNWKRARWLQGDKQWPFRSQDAAATCSPVVPQPALTPKHLLTQVTWFFSQPGVGKGLWNTLQSRSTEEPQAKIPLTFCHRDCVLYWFILLTLMFPLFLHILSLPTRNLGRTGVCTYINPPNTEVSNIIFYKLNVPVKELCLKGTTFK